MKPLIYFVSILLFYVNLKSQSIENGYYFIYSKQMAPRIFKDDSMGIAIVHHVFPVSTSEFNTDKSDSAPESFYVLTGLLHLDGKKASVRYCYNILGRFRFYPKAWKIKVVNEGGSLLFKNGVGVKSNEKATLFQGETINSQLILIKLELPDPSVQLKFDSMSIFNLSIRNESEEFIGRIETIHNLRFFKRVFALSEESNSFTSIRDIIPNESIWVSGLTYFEDYRGFLNGFIIPTSEENGALWARLYRSTNSTEHPGPLELILTPIKERNAMRSESIKAEIPGRWISKNVSCLPSDADKQSKLSYQLMFTKEMYYHLYVSGSINDKEIQKEYSGPWKLSHSGEILMLNTEDQMPDFMKMDLQDGELEIQLVEFYNLDNKFIALRSTITFVKR
jgi:hypothetical protein